VGALLLSSLPTLEFAAPDMAPALVSAAWLLFVSWLLHEVYRVSRSRSTLPRCRAWDQHGRPLRIEQV
jgi:hypothetical protein